MHIFIPLEWFNLGDYSPAAIDAFVDAIEAKAEQVYGPYARVWAERRSDWATIHTAQNINEWTEVPGEWCEEFAEIELSPEDYCASNREESILDLPDLDTVTWGTKLPMVDRYGLLTGVVADVADLAPDRIVVNVSADDDGDVVFDTVAPVHGAAISRTEAYHAKWLESPAPGRPKANWQTVGF